MTRRLRAGRAAPARDQGADRPEPPGPAPPPAGADRPDPPDERGGDGPGRGPEEILDHVGGPPRRSQRRRAAGSAPPAPTGDGADLVQRLEEEISQPSGLLRACLLLLLGEQPGHGYDLHERLKAFGFARMDASRSYRALHWLEKAELAEAHWETDNRGPARRVYELTPAGHVALERCVTTLQQRSRMLRQYVARYRRTAGGR